MFINTILDVNVAWECVNRAESVARNRARFKRILGNRERGFKGFGGHFSISG